MEGEENMSDEKTKMATSQPMKFELLVIIERGFPTGAIKMSCPATGCHGIGATESEAHARLTANIQDRELNAWVIGD